MVKVIEKSDDSLESKTNQLSALTPDTIRKGLLKREGESKTDYLHRIRDLFIGANPSIGQVKDTNSTESTGTDTNEGYHIVDEYLR